MPIWRILLRFEILQSRIFDKTVKGFQCKDLAPCGQDHLLHVFTADTETSPTDTSDDFVFGVICRTTGQAQFTKMLNLNDALFASE